MKRNKNLQVFLSDEDEAIEKALDLVNVKVLYTERGKDYIRFFHEGERYKLTIKKDSVRKKNN